MVEEYLGAVKIFAGDYAILNYAMCQGQTMSIAQNNALFALLGTTYGGNGISTFMLPNLQSALPLGWGNGQGLTPRVIGETGGVENVTVLSNAVPSHTHLFNASSNPTTTNSAGPTVLLGTLNAATDGGFYVTPSQTVIPDLVSLNTTAVSSVGGNQPHNNIQPSMGINYIICLAGIFPSRG
jgi:microcystin-dependent protein